jgi:hypothetical protein
LDVIPLVSEPEPSARRGEAPDFIRLARAPVPRLQAGYYEARSTSLRRARTYQRPYIEAWFDIFDGPAVNGQILARLPCYFRLPDNGRLAPSSKLFRWIQLLGSPIRRDRIPLRSLLFKLWRVEVGDVTTGADAGPDGQHRALHERQRYSVVRVVIERLA